MGFVRSSMSVERCCTPCSIGQVILDLALLLVCNVTKYMRLDSSHQLSLVRRFVTAPKDPLRKKLKYCCYSHLHLANFANLHINFAKISRISNTVSKWNNQLWSDDCQENRHVSFVTHSFKSNRSDLTFNTSW